MARERILQGDPDRVDPDAPLEDQVVLLPYDSKWEFPRNKLVLGMVINYVCTVLI